MRTPWQFTRPTVPIITARERHSKQKLFKQYSSKDTSTSALFFLTASSIRGEPRRYSAVTPYIFVASERCRYLQFSSLSALASPADEFTSERTSVIFRSLWFYRAAYSDGLHFTLPGCFIIIIIHNAWHSSNSTKLTWCSRDSFRQVQCTFVSSQT